MFTKIDLFRGRRACSFRVGSRKARLLPASSFGFVDRSFERMNLFHSGNRMLHTTQTYLGVLATQVASSV